MPKPSLLDQLNEIAKEADSQLASVASESDIESWRVAYLGRRGQLTLLLRNLSSLPIEDRRALGLEANRVKRSLEEKLNVLSHGFGLILSILGLVLLILRANELGETVHLVSFSIFGASMILLYAASTFYHSATNKSLRYKLNILDHASIYVLIAGSYTPFALVTLDGWVGWTIFGVVWGIALTGIILKLFFKVVKR